MSKCDHKVECTNREECYCPKCGMDAVYVVEELQSLLKDIEVKLSDQTRATYKSREKITQMYSELARVRQITKQKDDERDIIYEFLREWSDRGLPMTTYFNEWKRGKGYA